MTCGWVALRGVTRRRLATRGRRAMVGGAAQSVSRCYYLTATGGNLYAGASNSEVGTTESARGVRTVVTRAAVAAAGREITQFE